MSKVGAGHLKHRTREKRYSRINRLLDNPQTLYNHEVYSWGKYLACMQCLLTPEQGVGWSSILIKSCVRNTNKMYFFNQRNKANLHFRKMLKKSLGRNLNSSWVSTSWSQNMCWQLPCLVWALTTQNKAQDPFVVGMKTQWNLHWMCLPTHVTGYIPFCRSETFYLPCRGTLDCVVVFLGPQAQV